MPPPSKATFPWFGGKASVATEAWSRFGSVRNYIEPFFGSGAVWLACPLQPRPVAAVNDMNAYVANFWRAVAAEPDAVAGYCDWPVNEIDQEARHRWLVAVDNGVHRRTALAERMAHDPDYYDAKVAGWWAWGLSAWIGKGWCDGEYHPESGEGVGSQTCTNGAKLPHISNAGMGVHCQLPHIGHAGKGVHGARSAVLCDWFRDLQAAFRGVRVCCGDWSRLCRSDSALGLGDLAPVAVFLDPPYGAEDRDNCYGIHDSFTVAADVRAWCIDHGDDSRLRIALCGYSGEGHEDLAERGWTAYSWQAKGGYSNVRGARNQNAAREAIWFSPHCLQPQPELFGDMSSND